MVIMMMMILDKKKIAILTESKNTNKHINIKYLRLKHPTTCIYQFSSVQSLSPVRLFPTP